MYIQSLNAQMNKNKISLKQLQENPLMNEMFYSGPFTTRNYRMPIQKLHKRNS